jgi:4'-phosphopantetheinyl transferase EntD
VVPAVRNDVDAADVVAVGCDLELDVDVIGGGRDRHGMESLAHQVLLPPELQALVDGDLDDDRYRRAVFERFSLKEALYKGLDPFVRRYVGFHEVSVTVDDDGAAIFVVPDAGFSATGRVIPVPGLPSLVLTTAMVRRSGPIPQPHSP